MDNANDRPSKTSISAPCSPPTLSTGAMPSGRRAAAALISRLLSHFWTAADPPMSRQAQIEDWLEDLADFTPAVVAEACREWRRGETHRPTIAHIRRLCVARTPPRVPRPACLAPTPPSREISVEERQEVGRMLGELGRQLARRQAHLPPIERDDPDPGVRRSPPDISASLERFRQRWAESAPQTQETP